MTCSQNQNTNGPCPQYSFNSSTNQISNSGYTYDASGDLTNDGTHTYQYDAEGRLISVDSGSTASYVYNALGERVEKSVGGTYTEYVFDKDGNPLGENNRSGWTDTWVIFSGQHVAHYENGVTYFIHANSVGTAAFVTDYSGAVVQDELHYPWGEEWQMVGTMQEERYAGMHHRDSETNLDPTHYRMYSSSTYRWLTPDPAESGVLSPQTMSRYAYAGGNPVNLDDPSGLFAASPGPGCTYVGTGPDGEPAFSCYGSPTLDDPYWPRLDPTGASAASGSPAGSLARYHSCCSTAFGDPNGSFSAAGRSFTLSFAVAQDVAAAARVTGEAAAIIGATWAAESSFSLQPQNHANLTNGVVTSVDIGPMQLNSVYEGKDIYHPATAYGTNLSPTGTFNGNAWLNLLAGASYLKILSNPANYVGTRQADVAQRQSFLNAVAPKLGLFFNCFTKR
jgi:RHS repeat-associated protein